MSHFVFVKKMMLMSIHSTHRKLPSLV